MQLLLCAPPAALVVLEWCWIDEHHAWIAIPGIIPGLEASVWPDEDRPSDPDL